MTIIINAPIKCSTVKRIRTLYTNFVGVVIELVVLALLPVGFILMGLSLYVAFSGSDPNRVAAVFILFMCGFFCALFGTILWSISPPLKIKCIQDEAIKNE